MWAALCLLRRHPGIGVTVIEREATPGGMAGSFSSEGLTWDLGSHRFHPAASPELLGEVRELLGDRFLSRPRNGRILLEGRHLRFPLSAADMLLHMPPSFAFGALADAAAAPFRKKAPADASFAGIMLQGLGGTICRRFYFPYAEKLWGLSPSRLSGEQARRRVSAGTIGKMMRRLFAPPRQRVDRRTFHYPAGGFGTIFSSAAAAVEKMGGRIEFGATVTGVSAPAPGTGGSVRYSSGTGEHSLPADFILSTIPVTEFAAILAPLIPDDVEAARRSLSFRSMVLCFVTLRTGRFSPFDAHYFPGAGIVPSRMSERKNYEGSVHPPDSTGLCFELPCWRTDPLWTMGDEAIGGLLRKNLAEAGILLPAFSAVFTRRLPEAYPSYPMGWREHYSVLDTWLLGIPGIACLGRQGLFVHDNAHHAMEMGRKAAGCIDPENGWDAVKWAEARKEFQDNVVED